MQSLSASPYTVAQIKRLEPPIDLVFMRLA